MPELEKITTSYNRYKVMISAYEKLMEATFIEDNYYNTYPPTGGLMSPVVKIMIDITMNITVEKQREELQEYLRFQIQKEEKFLTDNGYIIGKYFTD